MILGNIREGGRGSARRNYPGQAVVLLAVALSASGLIPSLSDGTPSVPALVMVEISEIADSGPLALNGTVAVDAFGTGGGTYLAVAAAHDDGIQIINVTDPSNPVGTGSITDGAGTALDGAYDVDAFGTGGGTYLAVAAVVEDGIQIINVTDPSNPVGTGSITDGAGTALDGASAVDAFGTGGGTYLAVASYREGVQIVNVTDPSNPVAVAAIFDDDAALLDNARGVDAFRVGGSTYVAVTSRGDSSLGVVNVTDPARPVLIAGIRDGGPSATLLGGARGVDTFVTGGSTYAVVAAHGDSGLQLVDIADPSDPSPISSVADGPTLLLGGAASVTTVNIGSAVYALAVSMFESGVQAVEVTDPSNPVPVQVQGAAAPALNGTARDVAVFRAEGAVYAAVATGFFENSLRILEVVPDGSLGAHTPVLLPVPVSAAYHPHAGAVTVVFDGQLGPAVHADRLHVREAGGGDGAGLPLSGRPAVEGSVLTVTLNAGLPGAIGAMASLLLDIGGGAVYDMFGNPVRAAAGIPVDVPDTTPPGIVSATYDNSTGLLSLIFSEPLNHTATDHSGLAVLGSSGNITLAAVADRGVSDDDAIAATLGPDQRGMVGAAPALRASKGAVTDVSGNQIEPVTVPVRLTANRPPAVNAGPDRTVPEGDTIALNGTASDQDGDPLAYGWTSDRPGLAISNNDTLTPSFTAPQVNSTISITFALSVTDRHNATAADTVTVTVTDVPPANTAPTVSAGDDRTVPEGDAVTLNGTASDPDGDTLAYRWSHDSALNITLAGADALSPSFTAPEVAANTTITFTLTATDIHNATTSDQAAVTVTDVPANRPPAVDAGPDRTVPEGDAVTLNGTASDPDGDTLAYRWSHDSALNITLAGADALSPSFTAPEVAANTTITFTLTATDIHNATTSDQAAVTVTDVPANRPPAVDAGPDRTVPEGDAVTLNGTASDPDGDTLAYRWSHDSALNITLAGADALSPSFTAPEVAANTTITFTLTATDIHNATTSDQAAVTVTDVPANRPPAVDAGPDRTVPEGDAVTLNGTASDPDGDTLAYGWTSDRPGLALSSGDTPTPFFTTPQVNSTTPITFTLSVTDRHNATAADTVTITVTDVPANATRATSTRDIQPADTSNNSPPAVDAGPDRTVPEGDTVELTGTASDPDGDTLAYGWTSDRPGLALSSGDTPTPFFTTPQVNSTTPITFTLSVTDRHNATAADTVTVTVTDVPANATRATSTRDIQPADTSNNSPPAVDAGPDRTVPEGDTVELTGTASDPDGDTLAYGWTSDRPGLALSSGDTPTPFFTTPQVNSTTPITFTLSVTDRHNATAADTVTVTVTDVPANATRATSTRDIQPADTSNNSPPAVDAGPDRTIPGGYLLTLNGTASDPDGDTLTYLWSHDSALNITLAGADTLSTTFITPQVNSANTVVITLTVSDGIASSHDSLSVNITDSVPPANSTIPVITLLGPIEMDVQLNSVWTDPGYTATDSDGNDLTGNVTVTGAVDTAQAGIYLLYYQVVDAHGTPAIPQGRSVTVLAPEPQQQTQEPQAEPQQGAELGAEQEPQQEAEQEPTQEHEQEPQQQEDPQEQQEPAQEPEQEPTQEPEQEPESNLPAIVQQYDTDGSGVIEQDEWLVAVDDYTNYELTTPEIRQIAAHRG